MMMTIAKDRTVTDKNMKLVSATTTTTTTTTTAAAAASFVIRFVVDDVDDDGDDSNRKLVMSAAVGATFSALIFKDDVLRPLLAFCFVLYFYSSFLASVSLVS